MYTLNLQAGEKDALESLATKLIQSPWRWEILLKMAERPAPSQDYQMVVEAMRDCVAVSDPNADSQLWPRIRDLEKSRHRTDLEAARLLSLAARAKQPEVEVNK